MTPAAAVARKAAAAREAAVALDDAVAPAAAVAPDADDDSDELYYPSSDGCPVAEGGDHYFAIAHVYDALRRWFRRRGDVYVAADMFVYYERGNTGVRVAPDLFVVRGADPRQRETWKIWKEGDRPPQFVLEVASRSTRRADRIVKPVIYRRLGVEEYFQFDLLQKPVSVLRGLRLVDGEYEPVAPGGKWSGLRSEVLGLDLFGEDKLLRLGDPVTGERLPTSEEEEDARLEEKARAENAETRADEAETRADEAEARVRELEARLRSQ